MAYKSTRQVENLLGINNLAIKIWRGELDPPTKSPTGQYLWTDEDVNRASWQTRRRDASDVLTIKKTVFTNDEN